MNVLKMNKKFWLGGLAIFAMVFTGCLTDDKKDAATDPKITQQPTSQSVAFGDSVTFVIKATGTGTLTYVWIVGTDTVKDANDTLTGAPGANYNGASVKCIVTGTKGSVTSSTVTLTITGLTAWPAEVPITSGAQGHPTLGTAIDLDVPEVMLSAVANTRLADIDILFAYTSNGTDSVYQIMSPVAAKAAGVSVAVNYNSSLIVDTRFVKVTSKPANQQVAEEIFSDNADSNAEDIVEGDMFIVNTTAGKYVYLKIGAITSAQKAGSATFSVAISSI